MMQGVNIICKQLPIQSLAKPHCVVDGFEVILSWNKIYFIPLVPGVEHQIVLKVAHLGRLVGATKLSLSVRPGEVLHYEYMTSVPPWSGGCLRLARPSKGVGGQKHPAPMSPRTQ